MASTHAGLSNIKLRARVLLVNCGVSGLHKKHSAITALMESADADVACVTETHTRTASKLTTCGRNGEDTVLNQTRESRTGHSFGGVAVIVRAASTRITSAQITSCCPSADVMTVRLTDVNGGEHDIVATYIPPNQAASECPSQQCDSTACDKAHTQRALQYVAAQLKAARPEVSTLVLGDFNARVPSTAAMKPSKRWRAIQDMLLHDAQGVMKGPIDEHGQLLPTHTNGHGSANVLDLVIAPRQRRTEVQHAYSYSSRVVEHSHISDHCNILVDITSGGMPHKAPNKYGITSSISKQLTQRWQLRTQSATPEQWQHYQCAVSEAFSEQAVAALSHQAVEDSDSWVHQQLTAAAVAAGLLMSTKEAKRERITDQHRAARRALMSLQRQAARVGNATQSQVLQAQASLRATRTEVRRRQRARAQRARKQQRTMAWQALERTQTWRARKIHGVRWESEGSRTHRGGHELQRSRTANGRVHWQGAASATTRARRATADIQRELLALEVGLRERYTRPVTHDIVGVAAVQAMQVPARPPNLDELAVAMRAVKPGAACIGLPARLLKAAWAHPRVQQATLQLVERVWQHKVVPTAWTTARTTLLHKQGDKTLLDNYRMIATSTAMAKVYQNLLDKRIRAAVEPSLDRNQYGFRPHLSALQASITLRSAQACAIIQKRQLDTIYEDVRKAYPSIQHQHITQAASASNLDKHTTVLLAQSLAQQKLFTSIGNLNTEAIAQTIGLAEGGVMSPISYLLATDTATQAITTLQGANGNPVGAPLGGDLTIAHVSYADDMATLTEPQHTQLVMDTLASEFCERLGLQYNHGVGKTAGMFASDSKRAKLAGTDVRSTETYQHLGVWWHKSGRGAAAHVHTQAMAAQAAGAVARVARSRLAKLAPATAAHVYASEIAPTFTYGLHVACDSTPKPVAIAESSILRAMWEAPNCPVVVLRVLAGVPSPHTRHQASVAATALKMLTLPAAHPARQQLRLEAALHRASKRGTDSTAKRTRIAPLWYATVTSTLNDMDAACQQPIKWSTTFHTAVQQTTVVSEAMYRQLRQEALAVCSLMDAARHRAAIQERPSLHEAARVLEHVLQQGKRAALFTLEPRGAASNTRRQALSGFREWAAVSHEHSASVPCVWCGMPAAGVLHYYAECTHFETKRQAAWLAMYELAQNSALCTAHDPSDKADVWLCATLGIRPAATAAGIITAWPADRAEAKAHAHQWLRVVHAANEFVVETQTATRAQLQRAVIQRRSEIIQKRIAYSNTADRRQDWWLRHVQTRDVNTTASTALSAPALKAP